MAMTVWQMQTIDTEPHVVLTDWAVMQVALQGHGGDVVSRHFVGVRAGKPPRAQVSSPVVVFDPQRARGVTESGKIYQLNGFSPVPSSVLATWSRWKDIHQIAHDTNVSSEVVRDIFAAARAFGKRS